MTAAQPSAEGHVRFHLDEDSQSGSVVRALRAAGFDVETTADRRLFGASDDEQLAHATGASRVLISYNVRDFNILHAALVSHGKTHAGIILIHQERRLGPGEIVRRVRSLLEQESGHALEGRLLYLSNYD